MKIAIFLESNCLIALAIALDLKLLMKKEHYKQNEWWKLTAKKRPTCYNQDIVNKNWEETKLPLWDRRQENIKEKISTRLLFCPVVLVELIFFLVKMAAELDFFGVVSFVSSAAVESSVAFSVNQI